METSLPILLEIELNIPEAAISVPDSRDYNI